MNRVPLFRDHKVRVQYWDNGPINGQHVMMKYGLKVDLDRLSSLAISNPI